MDLVRIMFTNYDPTLTYTFNPVGPTIDASGLIQSMVLVGTSYTVTSTVTSTNSSLCTSIVSSAFVNQPMLITPVAPIVNVTAPTCTSDGVAKQLRIMLLEKPMILIQQVLQWMLLE